jgi:type II secretory ATPase GspE/PulE/Tfp pilus assembly ATPase PilB-like protein
LEAYQKRATDIHIEPYRDKMRLRYRIDGILMDANLPPEARHFLLPMVSRIKIMSNLSITEKRLPQDGSTVVRTRDQDLDLRISTMPALRGESMVIRILPTKSMRTRLEDLGLNEENALKFRELIQASHGIIFVTGPTGSGKTTTLYACLHELNRDDQKIITIEDPIEYEMEGITQIQISPKLNFSFAEGLRNILRHDPDIIMVGEVRDLETAEIAIRTSLTGHLVFSTLHTNDAASGITRLIDMGVEPYLVASSVEAFVAQRLIRLICPQCKQEDPKVPDTVRQEMAVSLGIRPEEVKVFQGRGCEMCSKTGYYGRTAIYEVLRMDETIRGMLTNKPSSERVKQTAMKNGMATLRQNGWQCVAKGITTVSEVLYVSSKDNRSLMERASDHPGV